MTSRAGALLVLALTLAVWAPTTTYLWATTWDDGVFFVFNEHIRSWDWPWMLTTQHYGHWMPLTWISATANFSIAGLNPRAWHAVNVGLHVVSSVLLYFIAKRLIGSTWGAVVAALVWAVHPLRMESVAWITERKDVLSGVFFLGAALFWIHEWRAAAFFVFLAGCLSKVSVIVLPVMLLALDCYRYGMTPREYWRTYPKRLWAMFIIADVAFTITAFTALATIKSSLAWSIVGLGPRLLHVCYSLVFYVQQTVWPARLSAMIEYTWIPSLDQWQYPLAVVIVVAAATASALTRRRWPAVTAALIAYTVAVLPQSGIVQNGPQLVANRYSYLASIPLALLVGGAFTKAWRHYPRWSLGVTAPVLGGLIAATLVALPMWRDGDTMWTYAADHEPTCTQCQDMASAADLRHGNYASALARQRQAITVSETTLMSRWERHWNLAAILQLMGRHDEAAEELRVYLSLVPADRAEWWRDDKRHVGLARAALAEYAQGIRR